MKILSFLELFSSSPPSFPQAFDVNHRLQGDLLSYHLFATEIICVRKQILHGSMKEERRFETMKIAQGQKQRSYFFLQRLIGVHCRRKQLHLEYVV